jgi:hypothetical protein
MAAAGIEPGSVAARDRWFCRGALALLLVLCALIYYPGLAGGFLFDDHANLPALGRFGPIDNLESLLYYTFSGIADPTGRPLAMLSFLIDANDWPASPWAFKRTNVCIHLVNIVLLAALLRRLGERVGLSSRHALHAALFGAAAWGLHPLWVSSVLYVVQRHALVATTFVLAGLLVWLAAERAFAAARTRRGWALALASILGCGLAAGLSKPIGFLLPLLALSITPTLAAPHEASRQTQSARRLLLLLPALLILVGLAYQGLAGDAGARPWTIGERLLTQPRVLLDYLRLLLFPDPYSSGVFADDYSVSTSLLQPLATLPALALLLGAAAAALRWRQRHPVLSMTVLFFLAGHLLESTVIPLELYFEHRNYLPAALLFWPLGVVLAKPVILPRLRPVAAGVALAVLAALTLARTTLWGDPLALAMNWARDYPNSARAQANAAGELASIDRGDLVLQRLEPLFDQHPGETQYAIAIANVRCQRGDVDAALLQRVASALALKGVSIDLNYQWLLDVARGSTSAPCASLDPQSVATLVQAARRGESGDVEEQARLQRVLGYHAVREGRCEDALAAFNQRMDLQRRPEGAIEQTGTLASRCSPAIALQHLQHYQAGAALGLSPLPCCALRARDWLMLRNGYWDRELDRLDRVLREDIGLTQPAD